MLCRRRLTTPTAILIISDLLALILIMGTEKSVMKMSFTEIK